MWDPTPSSLRLQSPVDILGVTGAWQPHLGTHTVEVFPLFRPLTFREPVVNHFFLSRPRNGCRKGDAQSGPHADAKPWPCP